jgi:hypothetical protein
MAVKYKIMVMIHKLLRTGTDSRGRFVAAPVA